MSPTTPARAVPAGRDRLDAEATRLGHLSEQARLDVWALAYAERYGVRPRPSVLRALYAGAAA